MLYFIPSNLYSGYIMKINPDNITQIFGLSRFYGGTGESKFYSTLAAAVRALGTDLVLQDGETACIRVFNMGESQGGPAYVDFHDHQDIVNLARMTDDQINEYEVAQPAN